ncbi:hypothetical protein DRV84_14395 [Rhodosalinus sediminis]|uniref:Uncharacterized protein n=1 Tax=Rhodosalinus sediminis TaxID=1940533 RepID=A0A3D9BKE2_9RHOB|nr:hypothetical protein [Rhodosalinus sediminis]REC53978.1 hypothetical protein DRV84_14395 [Rhodosalinus sediminis]
MGLDRAFFIGAFVVGVVGGIALKVSSVHPFAAAGFSATVLVGYAFLTWSSGRLRLEPEAVGDNCYYLGFLFTLASLAVTLWQVAEPPPGTTQAELLPGIISGFGVALSSTIVGVFLRVLMMQMRPDFVADEHEARTSLSAAMRDFRGQLSASNRDMKTFTVESIQQAKERDERIRASTEEFVRDAQKQLVEMQQETLKTLNQSASEALAGISREAEQAFGQTARSMDETLKAVSATLDGLQDKVSSLESGISQSERVIRGFTADVDRLQTEIQSVVNSFGAVVEDTDGGVKKFSANLSRAATRIETKTIPALEALEARLDKMPSLAGPWDTSRSASVGRTEQPMTDKAETK